MNFRGLNSQPFKTSKLGSYGFRKRNHREIPSFLTYKLEDYSKPGFGDTVRKENQASVMDSEKPDCFIFQRQPPLLEIKYPYHPLPQKYNF